MSQQDMWWIGVLGPYGAGKSTFIDSIAYYETAETNFMLRINDEVHQVEVDSGAVPVDDSLVLRFHSNPAAFNAPIFLQHVEDLEAVSPRKILGLVLLVDSTDPETFGIVQQTLDSLRELRVPISYVIAANKQDLDDAYSPDAVYDALHVPRGVPVIPSVASDGDSVRDVLVTLFEKVLQDIDTESRRIGS